jgi:DNA-binding NarL/FixJ family response regulator
VSSEPLRVLIIDDHQVAREGLRSGLTSELPCMVVGAVASGEEVMSATNLLQPDVVVVDLRLRGESGTDVCRRLHERWPGICVVVCSTYRSEANVRDAIEAGAVGYSTKAQGLEALCATIRQAIGWTRKPTSAKPIDGTINELIAEREPSVWPTPQEMAVLKLTANGMTTERVAGELGISASTVKFHLKNVKLKLGASTKGQLVTSAIRRGLISPPGP